MNLKRFIEERAVRWDELALLIQSAKRRPEKLGPDGVRRLGALYRSTAADLALARRRFPHDPVVHRLEALVGSARNLVYDSTSRRRSLIEFFTTTYWRLIRQRSSMVLFSAGLFFGVGALALIWTLANPATARSLVPPDFLWIAESRPEGTDMGAGVVGLAGFSTYVMVNNIQVTFLAFALGILWGIGTGWVLFQNGLILGVVAGLALDAGNGELLVAAVVGHGVLELSCIVVAGAAGLSLGRSILRPGTESRTASLVEEARHTMQIALGTAAWLVPAGILEGYLSRVGLAALPVTVVGVTIGVVFWGAVWWRGSPAATTELEPSLEDRWQRTLR